MPITVCSTVDESVFNNSKKELTDRISTTPDNIQNEKIDICPQGDNFVQYFNSIIKLGCVIIYMFWFLNNIFNIFLPHVFINKWVTTILKSYL